MIMDRHRHLKHVPTRHLNVPLVDQYMWAEKDTNTYKSQDNGVSHSIYDCKGSISFTLPLHMYPPVNDLHPQVKSQLQKYVLHKMLRYTYCL